MFHNLSLGAVPLCLLLCLNGCSTTPKVEKVVIIPPAEMYSSLCNRVSVPDGLTNEGLVIAFKAQDTQLKECPQKIKKAIDEWGSKQGKQPAEQPPQAQQAASQKPRCQWLIGC